MTIGLFLHIQQTPTLRDGTNNLSFEEEEHKHGESYTRSSFYIHLWCAFPEVDAEPINNIQANTPIMKSAYICQDVSGAV